MSLSGSLSLACALLNTLSCVLLVVGFGFAKRHQPEKHRRIMLSALLVSALFLVVYLARVVLSQTQHYHGPYRSPYLVILFSHMALAALVPPLVLRAVYLALKKRIAEHRRLVRWVFPMWLYVSVTGVVIYLFHHP
ncbi:MAG TPA: DUF420 domain-containing protein [Pseudomonadota bacterium]|jgi:putative membrane protein|nr:DUF420 domain-containing protein [Pseudomonadota bacterium]